MEVECVEGMSGRALALRENWNAGGEEKLGSGGDGRLGSVGRDGGKWRGDAGGMGRGWRGGLRPRPGPRCYFLSNPGILSSRLFHFISTGRGGEGRVGADSGIGRQN